MHSGKYQYRPCALQHGLGAGRQEKGEGALSSTAVGGQEALQ